MEQLSVIQLKDLIVTLEKELFNLQRNAEIHGVLDGRLGTTREVLSIAMEELERRG